MPPTPRKNWKRKGLRRVGKFQTFRAAFAHRSLEPIISLCEASDSHSNVQFAERKPVCDMPSRETNGFDPCVSFKKTRAPFLLYSIERLHSNVHSAERRPVCDMSSREIRIRSMRFPPRKLVPPFLGDEKSKFATQRRSTCSAKPFCLLSYAGLLPKD